MHATLNAIAVALVFLLAIPATLIPVLYGLRSPWWRHLVGRALFAQSVGMALLVDISCLYALFGDNYPGRDWVRVIVFGLVTAGTFGILVALIQEQRRRD